MENNDNSDGLNTSSSGSSQPTANNNNNVASSQQPQPSLHVVNIRDVKQKTLALLTELYRTETGDVKRMAMSLLETLYIIEEKEQVAEMNSKIQKLMKLIDDQKREQAEIEEAESRRQSIVTASQEEAEQLLLLADSSLQDASVEASTNNTDDDVVHTIRQRNIRFILMYTWIVFAGRSIWNQNVLATFCFLLENGDPKSVGYLTAAMGLSQLIVSFPVGYLADRYRRDHVLKVASFMGIVAAGTTLKVLFWNDHDHHDPTYGNLIVALCFWGCFWGIANTCLSAVFADSIDQGERSKYFTKRSILINLGNLSGPTVALFMFLILGNTWTIMDCAYVMGAGQVICLPAMVLLCFLKDPSQPWQEESQERNCHDDTESNYSNQEQGDSLRTPLLSNYANQEQDDTLRAPLLLSNNNEQQVAAEEGGGTAESLVKWLSSITRKDLFRTPVLSNDNDQQAAEEEEGGRTAESSSSIPTADVLPSTATTTTTNRPHRDEAYDATKLATMLGYFENPPKRIIPALVATADVLAGLSSGMSIRYFAIFLYDNLHLKPVHVQILYMITPLLQAGLAKKGQVLAKSYGRCRVTVTFKWIGISFMMAMIFMTKWNAKAIGVGDDRSSFVVAIICTLLVIRTAFMNSTSALTKSVLMDHVPNNERAKWSALESLNMFSWSGSAALGGILVDYHGILFNFCITAILQLVATLPHVLLARAAVRTTNGATTSIGELDTTTNGHASSHQSEVTDRIEGDRNNTDGQDRIDAAV